jgi:hypothetical protein
MDKADYYSEKLKEIPYEEPERAYYSISPSTKGRVMLQVYYGNVSMDETGINSLIGVLEASKAWLEPSKDKTEEEDNERSE